MRDIARFAVAVALACCAATTARPAWASDDACLDSLDAIAGVTYISATDTTHGPLDRPTACYFDPKWHFTYTWTWACHGDSMDVTITPRATIEISRTQYIRLPAGSGDSAGASLRWRRYQHDRVAISQDQRAVLLVQWLAAHLPPLHARTTCGARVQGPFADRVIGDAINAHLQVVFPLILANHAALAAATRQGTVALADREAFFAGLYDRAGLVRANFPYVAEAESLLVMPRYVNAPRPRCDEESL